MDMHITGSRTVFNSSGWCPVCMNILAKKIETLQMGPKKKMAIFPFE
jgi:hypothetical protein